MKKFNLLVFKRGFISKMFKYHFKIMTYIIVILTGCSLFLVICNAGIVDSQEQKPINNKKTVARLVIAIPDFKKMGGEKRYDVLKRSLPEFMAVSLIENDRVSYIPRRHFWKKALEMGKSQRELEKNNDLLYDDKILDALQIDLILKGNFFEYRGKVRIEAILEDRRKKEEGPLKLRNAPVYYKNEPIKISSKAVDIKGIFSEIENFSKKLNGEILSFEAEGITKHIAFLCFRDNSKSPSEHNDWLREDLAISLFSYLETEEEIKYIPWNQTKEFCEEKNINETEIFKKTKADALLTGEFMVDGENIKVVPVLYLKEKNIFKDKIHNKPLLEINGKLDNYWDLEYNLAEDVSDVLDTIIKDLNIKQLSSPHTFDECIKEGNDYMGKGNNYLAVLRFKDALKLEPESEEAHYLLGKARANQGRQQEAIIEFKYITENNPEYINARMALGDLYLKLGEYNKTINALEKAKAIAHKDSEIHLKIPDIHYRLGEVHYMLDQNETAIQELEIALKEGSKKPEKVYNMLGRVYRSQGLFKKEIDAYRKALDIEPDNIATKNRLRNAFNDRGLNEFWMGNYKEAISYYSESIEIDKENTDAYSYRGNTYLMRKKYERAIEDYIKVIELDREYIIAYENLSEVYIITGNYEDALDIIEKALSLSPKIDKRAILVYLKCVASKILGMEDALVEHKFELYDILEEDFLIIWDFNIFESWLEDADISDDIKRFIKKITEFLKKHNY